MSTNAFVPKVKPEHVIAFGDAIFAFAITLMTISIDIPDLPPNLTFHIIRFSIILEDPIFQWFT
jgi:uncharacterized membrane protein